MPLGEVLPEDVRERLKLAILARGFTWSDAAQLAGISRQTFWSSLQGKTAMSPKTLAAILAFLRTHPPMAGSESILGLDRPLRNGAKKGAPAATRASAAGTSEAVTGANRASSV